MFYIINYDIHNRSILLLTSLLYHTSRVSPAPKPASYSKQCIGLLIHSTAQGRQYVFCLFHEQGIYHSHRSTTSHYVLVDAGFLRDKAALFVGKTRERSLYLRTGTC